MGGAIVVHVWPLYAREPFLAMHPSTPRLLRRASAVLRHPALAVAMALVWMLGVEVGPGLHIARHGELAHHPLAGTGPGRASTLGAGRR